MSAFQEKPELKVVTAGAGTTAPGVVEISIDGGKYLVVVPNADTDYIQKKLVSERAPYELEMLRDMKGRLSAGDIVLDVGANVGNHTLYLAAIVGCRVTAFEPNDALCGSLLRSIEVNGLNEQVTVRAVALGSAPGFGFFTKQIPENLGAQSIGVGEGTIQISLLDSLVFPSAVRAIKIDVEGMELAVLEGGINLIKSSRPALYIECQTDKEFRTIHDWLSKLDYGFWDTFNATPTHLFLPNEQTGLEQRLERLQFKEAHDAYRFNQQLETVRNRLEAANLKYREATERQAQIKDRLAQEETARQVESGKVVHLTAQLEQAKAEKSAQEAQFAKLSEGIKAQIELTHEAQKAVIRANAEEKALRAQLETLTREHREATERQAQVKDQLAQEETARKLDSGKVANLTAELEQAKAEKIAQEAQLATLSEGIKAQTELTHEAQRAVIRADAEEQALRAQLETLTREHREVTERQALIKDRLAQEENARKLESAKVAHLTAQLEQAKAEKSTQEVQLATLSDAMKAQAELTHEAQKAGIRADAEEKALRAQLEQAKAEKGAQEAQLGTLSEAIKAQIELTHEAQKTGIRADAEAKALRAQMEHAKAEKSAQEAQLATLSDAIKAQTELTHEAQKAVIQADAEEKALRAQLETLTREHREATERHAQIKDRLAQEETARQLEGGKVTHLTAQLEQAKAEKSAQEAQLATLLDAIKAQTELTHEAQKAAIHADAEAKALRAQMEQAKAEKSAQEAQLGTLSEAIKAQTELTHEAQKAVVRADAEEKALRAQLETLTQEHREATERHAQIKDRLAQEEAARQAESDKVAHLAAQLGKANADKGAQEALLAELSQEVNAQTALTDIARQAASRAEAAEKDLQVKLSASRSDYHTMKDRVAQIGAESHRLGKKAKELEQSRKEVIGRNEELKGKLAAVSEEQAASESMMREIFRLHEEMTSRERRSWVAATAAQAKAERVQKHLSYRIGKALVENFSSPATWLKAPLAVWKSYREYQQDRSKQPAAAPQLVDRFRFDKSSNTSTLMLTSHWQAGTVPLTDGTLEFWVKPLSLSAFANIDLEWNISVPGADTTSGTITLKAGCPSLLTKLPGGKGEAVASFKKLSGKPCVLVLELRSGGVGKPTVNPSLPAPANGLPDVGSVQYKDVSYMQRHRSAQSALDVVYEGQPLISVVMTTYNTADLVDAAIESILNQSWSNLELIVVDDCSNDGTRQKAEKFAERDPRVRVYCFGENRGTYWCKNYGMTLAKGEVITFMDSDDLSHPSRLEEQFAELNQKDRAMVTCNLVRKDEAGNLITINGTVERIAPISKMIKRRVIEEIGYFDTIRTSADDEFMQRLKLVYGRKAHFNVPKVLYTALVREQSLTTDPENAINLSAARDGKSFLSPQRKHYADSYAGWHRYVSSRGVVPYMPFPVVNRPFPVYGKLVVKENRYDNNAISVCLASFPPRKEQLKKTVLSIIDRVDAIYIYLNDYAEKPEFLDHPRIHVTLGIQSKGDLRDNGKFFFPQSIPSGYCFTIDDDIEYPADYFESLIRKIEFYDRKAAVGLHGTIFAKPIETYFKDRTLFHFRDSLSKDVVVNQLGTGTVAFHTDLCRPSLDWFTEKGMADVFFAIELKRRSIPLITVERPKAWLRPQDTNEVGGANLFQEFLSNDALQTRLVKAHAPFDEAINGDLKALLIQRQMNFGAAFSRCAVEP